jgi:hypothetical protein
MEESRARLKAYPWIVGDFRQRTGKPASKPVAMENKTAPLLAFCESLGPEAAGCGLAALEADQEALIERFISGQCNDGERRELAAFVSRYPAWIRRIAHRVQMTRETSGQPDAK